MFKKFWYSTSIALIACLLASGTVLAAPYTRQVNRVGLIIDRGSSSFTLKTIGGQHYTVQVDDSTGYQRVSGGELSFRNIGVDQWVTAVGTFGRNKVLMADTVVVMPANLNKGHWLGKRAYGTVLQVIPGSESFTLVTENGWMRFTLDDKAAFTGNSVRSLDALQAGMEAVVSYKKNKDGSLIARSIGAY